MSSLRVAPFPTTTEQRSSATQKWKRQKKLGEIRGKKKRLKVGKSSKLSVRARKITSLLWGEKSGVSSEGKDISGTLDEADHRNLSNGNGSSGKTERKYDLSTRAKIYTPQWKWYKLIGLVFGTCLTLFAVNRKDVFCSLRMCLALEMWNFLVMNFRWNGKLLPWWQDLPRRTLEAA